MAVCAENVADKPCSFQQCKRSQNGGFMNTKIVLTLKTAYKAQIVPHKKRHYMRKHYCLPLHHRL